MHYDEGGNLHRGGLYRQSSTLPRVYFLEYRMPSKTSGVSTQSGMMQTPKHVLEDTCVLYMEQLQGQARL